MALRPPSREMATPVRKPARSEARKQRELGDVLGPAEAADRDLGAVEVEVGCEAEERGRLDRARADGDGPHAEAAVLDRGAAGEPDARRPWRLPYAARSRGAPSAAFDAVLTIAPRPCSIMYAERGACPVEHTAQVDVQHLGERLVARVVDPAGLARSPRCCAARRAARSARTAAATIASTAAESPTSAGCACAVPPAAPISSTVACAVSRVDVVHQHLRTRGREPHGAGPTDARPGSGDDHDLAVELPRRHAPFLPAFWRRSTAYVAVKGAKTIGDEDDGRAAIRRAGGGDHRRAPRAGTRARAAPGASRARGSS